MISRRVIMVLVLYNHKVSWKILQLLQSEEMITLGQKIQFHTKVLLHIGELIIKDFFVLNFIVFVGLHSTIQEKSKAKTTKQRTTPKAQKQKYQEINNVCLAQRNKSIFVIKLTGKVILKENNLYLYF